MAGTLKELIDLEAQIAYHDYMFHIADRPVLSDAAFDQLVYRRNELLEEFPGYTSSVIPGFVPAVENLPTIKLTEPMLSVSKYKTETDVLKWIERQKSEAGFSYEEKLDGVAIRLIYEFGILVNAHLRGVEEGTVIFHRIHLFKGIPLYIPELVPVPHFSVSGEAYVLLKDLHAWADNWEIETPESRSTVSGMLKRLAPEESDNLDIHFKAFWADKRTREQAKVYPALREKLTELGFQVPRLYEEPEISVLYQLAERPVGEYAIDGFVIKDNNLANWDEDKWGGYYKYAICYKFPTPVFETELEFVLWNLSTKGYLEGTVVYKPVEYDGSTMRRARFNYPAEYMKAGIRVGSIIEVTKGNEIVPQMVGLKEVGDGEPIVYPDYCPSCLHKLVVESPSAVKCTNPGCAGTLITRLERMTGPKGLDITSLGPKTLAVLVDNGLIQEPSDLFKLTEEDLEAVDIDPSTAVKIINSVKAAPTLGLNNWLFAASIPEMGYVRATELASEFGTLFTNQEELIKLLKSGQELRKLFNIDGLVMAAYVEENEEKFTKYLSEYDWSTCKVKIPDLIPIAMTGSWSSTKAVLKELLIEHGYDLEDRVSRSIHTLLVGEGGSPSKEALALRNGIRVINIDKLMGFETILTLLRK